MEYTKSDSTLQHTVNKAHNGLFVIVCCERCRKPEAIGPRCRKGRFSCKICIAFQDIFHSRSVNHEVVQALSFYGKFYLCYLLSSYFKGDFVRAVYEYTVTFICQIKWNIFVGLIGACTTIFVPDIYGLSVSYQCSETLTKSINVLIYIDAKLLTHVGFAFRVHIIGKSCPLCTHIGKVSSTACSQDFTISFVRHAPVFLVDAKGKISGSYNDLIFCFFHIHRTVFVQVQIKFRAVIFHSQVVACLHTDHVLRRCCDPDREIDSTKGITSVRNMMCRCTDHNFMVIFVYKVSFLRRKTFNSFLLQPASISKFHMSITPLFYQFFP